MNTQSDRVEATVTRLAADDFYFVALSDVGQDYFVPARNLERTGQFGFHHLKVGSRVSLLPVDGPKGMRGIEVRILAL